MAVRVAGFRTAVRRKLTLVAECGARQIVMGTDYPYPWTSTAVEHILGTPSLSDDERAAILGDTACKLLCIAS